MGQLEWRRRENCFWFYFDNDLRALLSIATGHTQSTVSFIKSRKTERCYASNAEPTKDSVNNDDDERQFYFANYSWLAVGEHYGAHTTGETMWEKEISEAAKV